MKNIYNGDTLRASSLHLSGKKITSVFLLKSPLLTTLIQPKTATVRSLGAK